MTRCLCPHCGKQTVEVAYQPRERRNEQGRWVDVGGFEIATCWNRDCPAWGVTKLWGTHATIDTDRLEGGTT